MIYKLLRRHGSCFKNWYEPVSEGAWGNCWMNYGCYFSYNELFSASHIQHQKRLGKNLRGVVTLPFGGLL